MNLPFFKKFNKKIVPLYYLVLALRDEKAEAVIFEELEGKVKIIGQKEQHFSTSIDDVSAEELLEVLDKAISEAEYSLPENIQTHKTIFGVKESWTDNDQIKKEYLVKLKKTSEELDLIPIGFLVISQAISHLLQREEGVPVSAILVEVNKRNVTVTLLRAGKTIETKSSEIHDSVPFTVDTLLKHFSVAEILPSRIIVFNGKEDLSQEFISYAWSKSLPFLHFPQITSLPEGFDAKAVLFGAATQMGFEVLEKDVPPEKTDIVSDLSKEETQVIKDETPREPIAYKNLGASDFGFAKDVDVAKIEFQEPIKNSYNAEKEQEVVPQIETSEPQVSKKNPKGFVNILSFAKKILIIVLGLIFAVIQKINIKRILPSILKGRLVITASAILIFIIVIFGSYFLFLKAQVTITVDPKIIQQDKSVTFSTTKTTDPDNNTIKGDFVTVSENGSASTAVTGKKDVGTSAKGTVTIFNSLTQNKTLTEGTILRSSNGLEFTLDSSITIKAVASHSADETASPEKATANVTAKQLGKESNLPSGTKFSVGSYDTSDLIAKNDDPFSGGTKKEVSVVSKNDINKLEENILKQLEDKAKEDSQKRLDQNKILLPTFITKTLSEKSLNAKVGDQTEQLTLTGTVEYQGISYKKNDLITFSKSLLSKNISSNQEIDYNNIKTSVLDIKNINDKEIKANLNIKALLLPKIDEVKLSKDLKSKSFDNSEDLIYKLPQVADVKIKLSPNLLFLPKNLPAREENIKIIILING
jgi:hypothetical protein